MVTGAITLPDESTVYEAARLASAAHLHIVIDRDGTIKLTPILLPGMQKLNVAGERQRQAA